MLHLLSKAEMQKWNVMPCICIVKILNLYIILLRPNRDLTYFPLFGKGHTGANSQALFRYLKFK